jgi:hypothetical protein
MVLTNESSCWDAGSELKMGWTMLTGPIPAKFFSLFFFFLLLTRSVLYFVAPTTSFSCRDVYGDASGPHYSDDGDGGRMLLPPRGVWPLWDRFLCK